MSFSSAIQKMKEIKVESEGSSEQSDADCDIGEIGEEFPSCPHLAQESAGSKNKFILHIAGTPETHPNIAVGLSDNTCKVYSLKNDQFANIATLSEHKDSIINIKFSTENPNLLYTASSDGTIKLWDIRTPKHSVNQFIDTTTEENNRKLLASFDVSPNNKLLAAGTDLFEGDAFILFWDIRKTKLLGGYWESHTEDITQVKFFPEDPNRLISGSTDGLINLYDLSQNSEDDALIDTFNTEFSIDKLSWHNVDEGNVIACISQSSEVQLWKLEDAQPFLRIQRSEVAKAMKRDSDSFAYVVDVYDNEDSLFLLAGLNCDNRERLRAMVIEEKLLEPVLSFPENKQQVRASWLHPNSNLLLTGGEKGTIEAWEVHLVNEGKVPKKKKKLE